MACYHPLVGVRSLTPNPDTGKFPVRIFKTEYKPELKQEYGDNYILIPCGRCIGCRLKYSREWADRCMLEASYYKHNWFLTLTYDDNHLPECHNGSPVHPLVKRDLQLFIKRLRKEFPNDHIRYFACGEYGSKSMRPHYHVLLFNCPLQDLTIHKRDFNNGFIYYISDTISRCWYPESDNELPRESRSSLGFHLLTELTWDTCAYTARYVMKKQKGKNSSVYEEYNYPPEFTLMSRKPGIGRQFYEDHNDIVIKDYYIPTRNGAKLVKSNRYFDRCFDIDYPNDLEFIKEDRLRIAEKNEFLKSNVTSLSYQERLLSEEKNKEAVTKILKRKEL